MVSVIHPIRKDMKILCDEQDYEKLRALSWKGDLTEKGWRFREEMEGGGRMTPAQYLLDAPPGIPIWYANGRHQDCRRQNLRSSLLGHENPRPKFFRYKRNKKKQKLEKVKPEAILALLDEDNWGGNAPMALERETTLTSQEKIGKVWLEMTQKPIDDIADPIPQGTRRMASVQGKK